MKTRYRPISCDLHDRLEALATKGRLVQVRFRDADGAHHRRIGVITDVFARDGAEYLVLDTTDALRLDQLVAVGEAPLDRRPRT